MMMYIYTCVVYIFALVVVKLAIIAPLETEEAFYKLIEASIECL